MAGERGQWGALVVGTSRSSTGLPALDAVRNNLVALRAALTDPALVAIPSPNVVVVPDPADPGKMLSPLSGLAEAVKDVLIVYFAGHGLLDLKGDLHLATTESSHANARWSAIRANDVRDLLRDAVATTRILILDCCFSGRALEAMGGGPESVIAGTLGVTGTVTIASAPPNATALAPIGATYTAFTGEFLSVITEGDSSVQSEHLDVETVYRLTQSRLIRNGWPRPQMLNQNEGHHIPLCRNVAHPAAGPTLSANADVGSDIGEAASTVRSQTPSPVLRSEWLHIDIPKLPMVNDVAFGPSDGWIAIAAGRTIHYYDVRTRMSRQVAKVGGFLNDVRSVEVSQYGDFLLGMHANGLSVWTLDGSLRHHYPKIQYIRCATNADILCSFTRDYRVEVFEIAPDGSLSDSRILEVGCIPDSVALNPTGTLVAAMGPRSDSFRENILVVCGTDPSAGRWSRPVWTFGDDEDIQLKHRRRLAFSRGSEYIATVTYASEPKLIRFPGSQLQIWDVATGELVHEQRPYDADFLAFSPIDPNILVTYTKPGHHLAVLNTITGTTRQMECPDFVSTGAALRFSPSGALLAIASTNGVWVRGATRDL